MKMIQAIVRPDKAHDVVVSLEKTGIRAFTRLDLMGHGRQKGIHIGTVHYSEIAKVWFMIVVSEEEVERTINAIRIVARTGNPGDGQIFVSPLTEVRTIRERGTVPAEADTTPAV
ncbi:MAG: P-II family nitrogen regulator [Thermoplasmataceae archaeon]